MLSPDGITPFGTNMVERNLSFDNNVVPFMTKLMMS